MKVLSLARPRKVRPPSGPATNGVGPMLEVRSLTKHFPQKGGTFGAQRGVVRAVEDVTFTLEEGRTFGLIGESGCGKTTTARLILRLEQPTAGSISFYGADVTRPTRSTLRAYKRSVQAVFQDPYSSLSPRMRIRDIVGEPLAIHEGLRGRAMARRVGELLDLVGINPNAANDYPHQFSGGQRQRIAIARALSVRPKLIVLDEPVSALDVSIRAQILNLLVDLQKQFGLSYLLISHDMAIVEHMCHEVAVMYVGQIVEEGEARQFYNGALHPYSRALLAAVPNPDPDVPLTDIVGGEVANPADPPPGCRFHPRCPLRVALGSPDACVNQAPSLRDAGDGHRSACHFSPPAPAETRSVAMSGSGEFS